jgi:hypothetical protein
MIDKATLERWAEWSKQDDWHTRFVGSDIRQMLGEIERLQDEIDYLHRAARGSDF